MPARITRGEKRRCVNCNAFLPKSKYDPHHICIVCRDGGCSFLGKNCDFCKDWPKAKWDSLLSSKAADGVRLTSRQRENTQQARIGLGSPILVSVSQPQIFTNVPGAVDTGNDNNNSSDSSTNNSFVGFRSAAESKDSLIEAVCMREKGLKGKLIERVTMKEKRMPFLTPSILCTLHGLSVDVMHLRCYVVMVHEEGEGAEGVEVVRVGAQVP